MNKIIQLGFRDLLFALVAVFFLFFLVPHKPDEATESLGEISPQGELIIEITWPPVDVDIDTWVQSPGENPVGYSNKGSRNCNLLRDDLGTSPRIDPLPLNFERAICRKLTPGEWLVGVHYYGASEYVNNIKVDAVIKRFDKRDSAMVVVSKTVFLEYNGSEATILHFIVTPLGALKVIPGDKFFGLRGGRIE